MPEPWELFAVVDGDLSPVPAAPERIQLGASDRFILAAARHAPRLVRALQRS